MFAIAAAYLLIINCWTYVRFADDKRRAVTGNRRIPESDLLGLAFMGGSVGAVLAQQLLRHKVRKEPFGSKLQLVLVVQIGLMAGGLLLPSTG